LILTPTIISSLSPAFHLPESSLVSALSSFTSVLSAELRPLDIPVTHLQLGTFDFSSFSPHNRQLATIQSQRAETLKWDENTRQVYGRNFVALSSGPVSGIKGCGAGGFGIGKGSSLRELNDAVFDAMVRGKGGVVRVGMGSRVYGFVGRWVPRGLVGWMMGMRHVPGLGEFGGMGSEAGDSRSTSPGSSANGGGIGNVLGLSSVLGESEYISVYGEKERKKEEV
jgi:hypothetical protein